MRIAALYDIHGNLPALEAVLSDVVAASPDLMVVGGDVVAGPMPRECLERLQDVGLPARYVLGNADREVVAAYDAGGRSPHASTAWVAKALERKHRDALHAFEPTVSLETGQGDTLFCHATPDSDEAIITAVTPDQVVARHLRRTEAALVVVGHTHMQYDRRVDGWRLVNAGSVGMPYGAPGAYWALIDDEVALRCTRYDVDAAASRIAASGYPDAAAFAERTVRNPPTAAEAVEVFERRRR